MVKLEGRATSRSRLTFGARRTVSVTRGAVGQAPHVPHAGGLPCLSQDPGHTERHSLAALAPSHHRLWAAWEMDTRSRI